MRHINCIHTIVSFYYFARRFKIIVGMFQYLLGQMSHKIEYACIFPLVLAECFIMHEQIDNLPVSVDVIYPVSEFIRGKRPLRPVTIGKSERDVVTKRVIFQKELEFFASDGPVYEVRASVT